MLYLIVQSVWLVAYALLAITITITIGLVDCAIKCKLAADKLRKQLPNVPHLEKDTRILGNHYLVTCCNYGTQKLHQRHKELGKNFTYLIQDYPCLSTVDLDLIKEMALDGGHVNTDRMPKYRVLCFEFEYDCILTARGDQWRNMRKVYGSALVPNRFKTAKVIQEIEACISKAVGAIDRQIERAGCLDGSKVATINVSDLMQRFAINMAMTCFYKQPNTIDFDLDRTDPWNEMLEAGLAEQEHSIVFRFGTMVPFSRRMINNFIWHLHPFGKWRQALFRFVKQQASLGLEARKRLQELRNGVDETKIDGENFTLEDGTEFKRNLVDHIIDQYHDGKLTDKEFTHSSVLLFSAIYKTSADVLMYIVYQIAINQDRQRKLFESIKEEGTESVYLDWFIKESLRLFPPANGGCSRTLSREIKLKDETVIPAGTFVTTPVFTIHRLEKYWGEDAEEFKPERWVHSDKFHPAQWIPFGLGIRGCPGRNFAMFEMKKFVSSLVTKYQFECYEIKGDLYDYDTPLQQFMVHKTPFKVNAKLRH